MSGFLSKSNISASDIANGIKMSEIPGDRGIVNSFLLIITNSGLSPGSPGYASILSPANPIVSESGPADEFGHVGISLGWLRITNDTIWGQVSGGGGLFPNGFWDLTVRGNISISGWADIDISFSSTDVLGFTQDLTTGTDVPIPSDPSWDGNKGQVTLNVHYDDTLAEHPDSIAIIRDGVAIANIPLVIGVKDYSFVDTVFAAGTYSYSAAVYKYPNSRSALSLAAPVSFGGPPTFELVGSGGFSLGGSAIFGFLVDPSGLYKLVIGKTHDTIYTNSGSSNDTVNVAIP